MGIEELMRMDEAAILDDVCRAVTRLEHYRRDGDEATRWRLQVLYRRLVDAVLSRDLAPLRGHLAQVARERYQSGFDLAEVHGAFSALQDAIWRHAVAGLEPDELAWGFGLVATALAHGRDALERTFASLTRPEAPIDLTPLFLGTEPSAGARADDLVFPV
jgi:hypothetical protein